MRVQNKLRSSTQDIYFEMLFCDIFGSKFNCMSFVCVHFYACLLHRFWEASGINSQRFWNHFGIHLGGILHILLAMLQNCKMHQFLSKMLDFSGYWAIILCSFCMCLDMFVLQSRLLFLRFLQILPSKGGSFWGPLLQILQMLQEKKRVGIVWTGQRTRAGPA